MPGKKSIRSGSFEPEYCPGAFYRRFFALQKGSWAILGSSRPVDCRAETDGACKLLFLS